MVFAVQFECSGTKILCGIVISVLVLALPVQAHQSLGQSGGQIVDTGDNHIEFIGSPADTTLIFVITDAREKPISLDVTAAAVIVADGMDTKTLPLTFLEPNWFEGQLARALSKGAFVKLTIELSTGRHIDAKFTVR
jgi:hypothetical protein